MKRSQAALFSLLSAALAAGGLVRHAAATEAFTSAGTNIAIVNDAPATEDAAGYAAQAHLDIGEVVDIPEFGKEYNLVTHNPLRTRRTRKYKGSYNLGSVTLNMARAPGDAGQAEALAALNLDDPSSFEVTLQDGTKMYFMALVMSYKTSVGTVDSITAASVTLEIDSEIVEVPAP